MKRGIDQTMAWVIALLLGGVVYGGGTMIFVNFGSKRVEAESSDGEHMSAKAHHGKAKAGEEDEAEEHGASADHGAHAAKAKHGESAANSEHGESAAKAEHGESAAKAEHGESAAKAEHGEDHGKSGHEKTVKADESEHGSGQHKEKHH